MGSLSMRLRRGEGREGKVSRARRDTASPARAELKPMRMSDLSWAYLELIYARGERRMSICRAVAA